MKIIRGLKIQESVRRLTRDARLDAQAVGKVLTLGTAWTGSLAPLIDGYVAALGPLVNGFTSGQVLHAEEIGSVVNLGKTWTDALRQRFRDASVKSSVAPEDEARVDVAEVLAAVGNLNTSLGIRPPNFQGVRDSLRKLKAAADKVTGRTSDRRTSDSRIRGYSKPQGNGSRAITPQQVMEAADKHWRPSHTVDNATVVRDALRTAGQATTMRDKIDALNAAHRAYWAERAR